MINNVSVRGRGTHRLRAVRNVAFVAFVSVGAIVPTSVVGAGSNAPAGQCQPVAVDDAYSTDQDVPLSVGAPGVKANDTDCGFSVEVVSTTAHGSLTLNPDGSFVYTPNAGYAGPDEFDYLILGPGTEFAGGSATEGGGRRPQGGLAVGNVDIDVIAVPVPTDPPCSPVAIDDAYSTDQDVPLSVGAPGVKANDTADCGLDVEVSSTTGNGSVTLNTDGSFDYTPNAGYSGPDQFTYFYIFGPPAPFGRGPVTEGRRPQGSPEYARVEITVIAAPVPTDPPCAPVAIDDAYATPQDVVLTVALPGVTVNDTDCGFFVHLFSNPTNGTLTLNADGTFAYTPTAGFTGVDTFEYALAENPPGFAGGRRLGFRGDYTAGRAPQGAADNVATVTITITGAPPATTSTTTTPTPPTTTTTPTPTPTTDPPSPALPATR